MCSELSAQTALGVDLFCHVSDKQAAADVQGVWAVHFFPEGLQADESSLYHAFLLVSTRTGTKVLRTGEDLDELSAQQAEFVLDSRTIFAGNLLQASRIVQVLHSSVTQCPVLLGACQRSCLVAAGESMQGHPTLWDGLPPQPCRKSSCSVATSRMLPYCNHCWEVSSGQDMCLSWYTTAWTFRRMC